MKKFFFFLTRVSLGWIMLYSGITKILDPKWSAKGYVLGSKTFPELYQWFASDQILPVINLLNAWGMALIGLSLVLGFFVKFSAPFGALLMLLYYFPALDFPMASKNYYIIDFHIIFALVFILLIILDAGKYWGLDYYRSLKGKRR